MRWCRRGSKSNLRGPGVRPHGYVTSRRSTSAAVNPGTTWRYPARASQALAPPALQIPLRSVMSVTSCFAASYAMSPQIARMRLVLRPPPAVSSSSHDRLGPQPPRAAQEHMKSTSVARIQEQHGGTGRAKGQAFQSTRLVGGESKRECGSPKPRTRHA